MRSVLWMLGLSLALGLALGTCIRREAEAPARYLGAIEGNRVVASDPAARPV